MMKFLTQIKHYYFRFDYYCDLVIFQNKKNLILLLVWFIGGVIFDMLFSIVGFLTIGIEYEKNPLVVQSWQSNTYYTYLVIYILGNLIFFLIFFEFLVLLGVFHLTMEKKSFKRSLFFVIGCIVGVPAYLAIEHYSQGLCWIIAILFNKTDDIFLYIIFVLLNFLICAFFLIRFLTYDYNLKGEMNEEN